MAISPRVRYFLTVGAASAAIALLAYGAQIIHGLELSTQDARFSLRGTNTPPSDLVIVGIDDATFSDLGIRFPFPRSLHAQVINRLAADGVRQIAYDVQFTEQTTPAQDNALIAAVKRAGHVVLATTQASNGRSGVFGGDEIVHSLGARVGDSVYDTSSGAVIRRVPFEVDGLKSFAVATVESLTGRTINQSDLHGDSAWIDYYGPPGTFQEIPLSRVLAGKFAPGTFRGKTVVVGATSSSLQDVHPTPTSTEVMAGPEIQANAIATAEHGFPLQSSPLAVDVVLITLFSLLAPAANFRLSALRALGAAVVAAGLYLVVAQIAFASDLILPVAYPLLGLTVGAIGSLAVNYHVTSLERQRVHDTFARFVPEPVVGQLLTHSGGDLRLGGVRREVTVLFSDIRGFTTFSETREPEEVVEILNRYLSEMTDAIMDTGGTLVSYIGDGIMAMFGAPIEQPDHADRALASAREMLDHRLPRFNEWMIERGEEEPFRIGIGLHSGPVMSGQIGSDRRLDYTAIGDTVNTASRLEGMTKGTPHQLMLSDATKDHLLNGPSDLVFVEEMRVRGRAGAIKVWSIKGDEPTG